MPSCSRPDRRRITAVTFPLLLIAANAACPAGGPVTPGPKGFPAPQRSVRSVGARSPADQQPPAYAPDFKQPPRPSATAEKPLRVTFYSPKIRAAGLATIQVTFDQPMVRLGAVRSRKEDPARFPISIDPPVQAVYRWVGGDTLKVALTQRLHPAQIYRVTLLPSLRSLAGAKLAKPLTWRFETPRPRILSLSQRAAQPVTAQRIHPRDQFAFSFTLPVTPAKARPFVHLLVNAKPQPFDLKRDPKTRIGMLLVPAKPFPAGATIDVRIKKGVKSSAGPLTSTDGRKRRWKVHGPLTARVLCDNEEAKANVKCWPMLNRASEGLELVFTEPVTLRALQRHLRIQPAPRNWKKRLRVVHGHRCSIRGRPRASCGTHWQVGSDLLPERAYRVTLGRAMTDAWGQTLTKPVQARFGTRSFPPGIHMAYGGEAFRERWQPYGFKTVNTKRVAAKLFAFRGAALVRFSMCVRKHSGDWPDKCLKGQRPTRQDKIPVVAAKNKASKRIIGLPPGLVAIGLSSPQVVDSEAKPVHFHRLAMQTDLGLHVRLHRWGATAWTTSLRSGKPLAGVTVGVYTLKAKLLWSGKTGAGGLVDVPRKALERLLSGKKAPKLMVVAERGPNVAYLTPGGRTPGPFGGRQEHYAYDSGRDNDDYDDDEDKPESLELHNFSGWGSERTRHVAYISTERGIYRPGHRVYVHGALRRFVTWKGAAATGETAVVQLLDPAGRTLATRRVKVSDHGVFLTHFELAKQGKLGRYYVSVKRAGAKPKKRHRRRRHWYHPVWSQGALAYRGFRVAEYREPRFKARLRLGPGAVYPKGTLRADFSGRYLFGGAMGGAAYRLRLSRSPTRTNFTKYPDHYAGAYGYTIDAGTQPTRRFEGVLDAKGEGSQKLPLTALKPQPNPWISSWSAEVVVESSSRRRAAAWWSTTQLPGDRLVAVASRGDKPNTIRRHVLVVTPDGKALAGQRVRAELFALEKVGVSWSYRINWKRRLWKKDLVVGRTGKLLAISWPKQYKHTQALLQFRVTDAKGREARTAERVGKPDAWTVKNAKVDSLTKRRDAQLTVKLDRKNYLPGQIARVTVRRNRAVQSATLFVERERIFKRFPLRFDARGMARVELKVTEAYSDTVTLRAIGVRAGKALRGKLGPLLAATATLAVKDDPWTLDVSLKTDRKIYRPQDTVKVSIQVKTRLGIPRRSQVVLMAVDEAVLNLTNYHLPSPYSALAHTPANGVTAEDIREHLVRLGIPIIHWDHTTLRGWSGWGGYGGGGGGGGGMGGAGRAGGSKRSSRKKPRRNFVVAPWHATVMTDAQGKATTTFKLPDNLTGFRIMAFAVDNKRSAGRGRTRFSVDLPLMTMPAFPRLLREGDRTDAGVVIYNASAPAGPATVTLRAEGNAIALVGPGRKTVTVPKGAGREVRFALQAKIRGLSKLHITVSKDGREDRLVWPLKVQRPVLSEAASVSGETKSAVRHGLEPLGKLRKDHGGLELSLTSTALAGVEDGMEQLINYPYGCLEQTASRLLPLIAAAVLGKRFALKLPSNPNRLIRTGLARTLSMQRSDGGFGYWPKSRISSAWATAYALVVMHRLKLAERQTGIRLPSGPLAKAIRYLRRYVGHRSRLGTYWFAYETFLIYSLRLHGIDVTTHALRLFAKRAHRPLFAKAMLTAALALSKQTPKIKAALNTLVDELGDRLKIDGTTAHAAERLQRGYQVMMHSNDRSSAMVLLALLQARPKHPHITRLVKWFLMGRKQARFRNTQEAAWALMAFWDFARIRERAVPDFEAGVWLGKKRLVTAHFKGRSVKPVLRNITMAELQRLAGLAARDLTIAKRGKGTLYYVARLRYARRKLPTKPRDRGFAIKKQVLVLDNGGRPLAIARPPRLGDTLLVTLRIKTTEARRYVVVDDPLPAGLEAIDSNLSTASRDTAGAISWRTTSRYDHRELRDDRVLFFRDLAQPGTLTYRYLARVTAPGRFLQPPSKAEEMYNPEIFGHNAAVRLTYRTK